MGVRRQAGAGSEPADAAVSRWVSENPVVVFSKTWCPFCQKAKDALGSAGADFLVVELDEREDGDDIQAALEAKTGVRTVPRVFIGGKCIGGGDDTVRLLEAGELAQLVKSACATAAGAFVGEVAAGQPQQARLAHWALRTSDLRKTLDFLEQVCGMAVQRHEESDSPCALNTNGSFKGRWSKTLVGYGPEDASFCLALTYNYGVAAYAAGAGLAHFGIGVDDPEEALAKAAQLGYAAEGDVVTGPDGYRFRLLPEPGNRADRFLYAAVRVGELPRAVEFYGDVLGMQDLTWDFEHLAFNRGGTELMRVVGFSPDHAALLLYEDPTSQQELKLDQWDGRHVLALPEVALRSALQRLEEAPKGPEKVLHSLSPFDQRLGSPLTTVFRDADGYEVCLVGGEVFDAGVSAARGSAKDIDWEWRQRTAAGGS